MAETDAPEPERRMDQLMREASLWFARMRGPDAEGWRPQFEHWLALGAAHRGAYDRAGEIFALGRFMAAEAAAPADEANDNDERARHWRRGAIAASLILAVGLGGWFTSVQMRASRADQVQLAGEPAGKPQEQAHYETQDGQRKSIRLADGSKVDLEAGSDLVTSFTAERRQLRLHRGRARFDVGHDGRPFIVLAGGGSVIARGTVFDVILGADKRVTVHLFRGAVDVERPNSARDHSDAMVARLEPGEVLSFTAVSTVSPRSVSSRPPILHPAAPEPDLVREFERTPLAAVIAEASRDSATSIRLADPALGALRVSGRFRVNDADQVAERLATLFDLEVEKTGSGEITLRRHKKFHPATP